MQLFNQRNKLYTEKYIFDDITNSLKLYLRNKLFLRFDNGSNNGVESMFFGVFSSNYLEKVEIILFDGTLWSVLFHFTQLITLNDKISGNKFAFYQKRRIFISDRFYKFERIGRM